MANLANRPVTANSPIPPTRRLRRPPVLSYSATTSIGIWSCLRRSTAVGMSQAQAVDTTSDRGLAYLHRQDSVCSMTTTIHSTVIICSFEGDPTGRSLERIPKITGVSQNDNFGYKPEV